MNKAYLGVGCNTDVTGFVICRCYKKGQRDPRGMPEGNQCTMSKMSSTIISIRNSLASYEATRGDGCAVYLNKEYALLSYVSRFSITADKTSQAELNLNTIQCQTELKVVLK